MLALPAVTPVQQAVVLWVMQIGGLVLRYSSVVCHGLLLTSVPQNCVPWNVCAADFRSYM